MLRSIGRDEGIHGGFTKSALRLSFADVKVFQAVSIEGLVQRRSFQSSRLERFVRSEQREFAHLLCCRFARTGKVIRSVTAAQNAFMHSRIDFTQRVFFFISTRRRRRRRRRCFLNFLYHRVFHHPVVFQSHFLFVPWRLPTSSLELSLVHGSSSGQVRVRLVFLFREHHHFARRRRRRRGSGGRWSPPPLVSFLNKTVRSSISKQHPSSVVL